MGIGAAKMTGIENRQVSRRLEFLTLGHLSYIYAKLESEARVKSTTRNRLPTR